MPAQGELLKGIDVDNHLPGLESVAKITTPIKYCVEHPMAMVSLPPSIGRPGDDMTIQVSWIYKQFENNPALELRSPQGGPVTRDNFQPLFHGESKADILLQYQRQIEGKGNDFNPVLTVDQIMWMVNHGLLESLNQGRAWTVAAMLGILEKHSGKAYLVHPHKGIRKVTVFQTPEGKKTTSSRDFGLIFDRKNADGHPDYVFQISPGSERVVEIDPSTISENQPKPVTEPVKVEGSVDH
jgi:hypothetical protein